jgi:hypothetical protein
VVRTAEAAFGPVALFGPARKPVVYGNEKERLTLVQHDVVQALVVAGNDGLNKDELEAVAPSARKALYRLAKDPDWARALVRPGARGGPGTILGPVWHAPSPAVDE